MRTCAQASEMQKDGWVLLDVRVDDNFDFEHIKDSVSIPLYRPVQGRSMFDNAKRLAMASFAMKATGAPALTAKMSDSVVPAFRQSRHFLVARCSTEIQPHTQVPNRGAPILGSMTDAATASQQMSFRASLVTLRAMPVQSATRTLHEMLWRSLAQIPRSCSCATLLLRISACGTHAGARCVIIASPPMSTTTCTALVSPAARHSPSVP